MTEDRMLDLTTMLKLSSMLRRYLALKDPQNLGPFAKEVKRRYDKLMSALLTDFTEAELAEGWTRIKLDAL